MYHIGKQPILNNQAGGNDMTSTTDFDIIEIKNEILNKLRSSLNTYDSKSRITETTTTFDGDDATTNFLLGNTLSYIKSVTVGGTALDFITGYSIVWRGANKGSVELVTAPATGVDNVVVVWGKKGTIGNFIFPDFPRTDLGEASYPRIGFRLIDNVEIAGLGGGADIPYKHEMLLQIKVVALDSYEIDYLSMMVHNFITTNCKKFYYFNYIDPQTINEYDNFSDNTDKSLQKVSEYKIPHKYNIVTLA